MHVFKVDDVGEHPMWLQGTANCYTLNHMVEHDGSDAEVIAALTGANGLVIW
jgi:hypothetical protein